MDSLREALLVVVRKLDFNAHYSTERFNEAFDTLRASFTPDEISSGELKLIEPRGESELREALEPFAAYAEEYDDINGDSVKAAIAVRIGWLRRARQALATPSAPVSGLVAEIDALLGDNNLLDELPWKHLKSGDEIRPDAPNAVAQLNALLTYVNAWPRIKSALASRDEWRPEVKAFADLMEKMLASKDAAYGGNSWKKDTPEELCAKILGHTDLLEYQTDQAKSNRHNDDPYDVDYPMAVDASVEQAVHIANYAMMIADVCGALPTPPTSQETEQAK